MVCTQRRKTIIPSLQQSWIVYLFAICPCSCLCTSFLRETVVFFFLSGVWEHGEVCNLFILRGSFQSRHSWCHESSARRMHWLIVGRDESHSLTAAGDVLLSCCGVPLHRRQIIKAEWWWAGWNKRQKKIVCYHRLALFRVRKPCVGAVRSSLLSVGLKGHPHTLSHTPRLCKGFANLHGVCSHLRPLKGQRADARRTTEEKHFCWSEWCICPAADRIMLPSPVQEGENKDLWHVIGRGKKYCDN